MTTPGAPDTKTLVAAAQQVDRTWDAWMTADGDDPLAGEHFEDVVAAVGSLRRALDGTRRVKLSKDRYGYWRPRCTCGWPGSPWGDGRDARQKAIDEFAWHVCYET